jgi:hypothetical protein
MVRLEEAMFVNRWGSRRYHDQRSAALTLGSVKWQAQFKRVEWLAYHVPDFNTTAHHTWTVGIRPDDMAELVMVLAAGIDETDSAKIGKAMRPALRALLRLALAAADVKKK